MIRVETIPVAQRIPIPLLRLALPVVLVGAAVSITLLLLDFVATTGYFLFYAAVVASAWFGGKWSGWLAVTLSTLVVDYVFIPPIHSFEVDRASIPLFVAFAASSLVVGWFSSWRKQAEKALEHARDDLKMRVEERTATLRETNERLLEEISERKRVEDAYYVAQADLARVTRISALGALAASISHEVNQPLTAVVANADACTLWLASDPPNLEEVRAAVDSIAREGTRASDVIRHIRAIFTKAAPERTRIDVNDLIREACSLMQVQICRNQVALETSLARDLPVPAGDPVQLQQVLVNLILNGIEAMTGVTHRPRRLIIRTEKLDSDEVLVAVRDCGIGIDPQNEKRIFDAFFTSKPEGMGMGLAIRQSIIEAHGGRLWASANSDHGVTLQFTLPSDGFVS